MSVEQTDPAPLPPRIPPPPPQDGPRRGRGGDGRGWAWFGALALGLLAGFVAYEWIPGADAPFDDLLVLVLG